MTDSNVRNSESTRGANAAMPHARVEGRVRRMQPFASDNTNPAGGINSSAADMAKWMRVLLREGSARRRLPSLFARRRRGSS